jgi:hypothetical protein
MNFMKSARDNVNKMMGQMGVDAQSYGRSASAQVTLAPLLWITIFQSDADAPPSYQC